MSDCRTCPVCNGTGSRKVTAGVSVICDVCGSTGKLPHWTPPPPPPPPPPPQPHKNPGIPYSYITSHLDIPPPPRKPGYNSGNPDDAFDCIIVTLATLMLFITLLAIVLITLS